MDAVKLKMDAMVKEKVELLKVSKSFEVETKDFEAKCAGSDKAIRTLEKAIANCEDELDTTLTNYISAQEKLEEAEAIATASELDVNALTRKIKLVQEESARVEERYRETIAKVSEYEKTFEDNERERKKFETKSFAIEEKLELMVTELEEATRIAEEADRKYEEVLRKHKIVESDLDRINEKAEEFEQKITDFDAEISDKSTSLRKLETICGKNADKEDELDNEQRSLVEKLKIAETNAEFGERTVEKLERTIDGIQDALYEEKMSYRDLSMKLDTTLRDMMKIAEDAMHDCE
jgi:chromosome segregation ATPase